MIFILLLQTILFFVKCNGVLNIGEQLDVESNFVLKEAEFAVKELSKLSDSLIYNTLQLSEIISARQYDGIFHTNVLLELRLSSPHFKSGAENEIFNMITLEHKEDGTKTLAIDEFPNMNEVDIEAFTVEKMRTKRKEREEVFRRMEIQAQLQGLHPTQLNEDYFNKPQFPADASREEQLRELDSEQRRLRRAEASAKFVQPRLSGSHLQQEQQLMEFSLVELHQVEMRTRYGTDYQQYRAERIIRSLLDGRSRWE